MSVVATNGDTLLHVAMRLSDENRCLILTKLLVEAGSNPGEFNMDDKPPIHFAVMRGFVSVVEHLISQGVLLPKRILFTALRAPGMKRVEMVSLLIGKGAAVHVVNPDGDTLLHVNMRSPNRSVCMEIAKRLADVGCSHFTCNIQGETPLNIAAMQGYHEVVKHLILSSTTLDILSLLQDPTTPASTLCSIICNCSDGLRTLPKKEDKVFRAIEQFADDEDAYLKLATTLICVAGDLFTRGSGNAILFDIAVRRGFSEVVEFLTSQSVTLPPAILFTALRHNESMIPFLIRKGANVHVQEDNGDTLLHVTMSILLETPCCATTRDLVEAGCDPSTFNNFNQRPIHIAMSRGFVTVVQYLLSHSRVLDTSTSPPTRSIDDLPHADLTRRAGHQTTPESLSVALALQCRERVAMFRWLVNEEDNFSLTPTRLRVLLRSTDENECLKTTQNHCETGWNVLESNLALHITVTRGLTSVVDYLLSRNVPVPQDILFFAFSSRSSTIFDDENTFIKWISMISSLVHKGADIHARDGYANTILHRAMWMRSESQCLQVTRVFVEAGCNLDAHNDLGNAPLDLAHILERSTITEYLRSISHTHTP